MDLPELAEDGCNWQTYGSWVLKAISEDGLMGHLDGSETRLTTPKLLQEYGARWTPQTNTERDVVMAWKTTDNVWHQRATMAHQFIIYGLPDSILMLCMHLDTPREAFAYLECRYGPIPRPESIKVADEAMPQCDMQSEQYATEEGAQGTYNSDNESIYSPEGEDSLDILNDCTETKSGFLTPKTKVTDAQHVEPHLLVVEVGAMDSKWLDEGMDAPKAPDKGSQHAGDEIEEDEDLPQMSSEALETRGDLPFTTCKRTKTQTGHRKPKNEVVDTQQMVDVLPMFEVGTTGRTRHDKHVKEHEAPDEGGQRADNKVEESRDLPKSSSEVLEPAGKCSMEDVLQTPIEDYQHAQTNGEMIANIPDLPSTPTELPIPCIKCPTLQNRSLARKRSAMTTEFDLSYTRRSGKWRETKCLELDCKRTSRHPQRTHRGHSACKTPPDEARGMGVLSSPRAGWGDSTMAGSTATKLERRVVSAKTAEIQAYIPHLETRPKEPDKAEDTGGGGDDAASKDILDSHGVEKTSLANSGSQQGERKTRWWNSLPAPPETPANGFIHPPRTLTDRYCHSRIKTDLQKLSTGREMERRQGSSPVPPAPPPNGTYYIHKSSKGLRHRARLKSNAENMAPMQPPLSLFAPMKWFIYLVGVSWMVKGRYNKIRHVQQVKTRGRTYQIAHILMRLLQPFSMPSKRLRHPMGGLWIMEVGCSEVGSTSKSKTRGRMHHTVGIYMQLPQVLSNPSKRLRNVVNTYWRKGVPPGSIRNDAKQQRNVPMAKRLPRSSGTRQDNEYRAERPNDSPAPSKPTRYDLTRPPGTFRNSHRHARIRTRSKNVSTVQTRGCTYLGLTVLTSPPREMTKILWNVTNTYWRHGIPPGRTRNIETPSLFDTAALRQQYKARGRARTKRIPEMAVATTRSTATATTRHLATLHGLEAAVAAIILIFILIFSIQFSFEFYILHPYLITQWSFRGCVGV
ncbi:hypothetical protein F5141DRAFT_1068635 [Pisolithus sp. B1]|nr:hypothetical protein F5141DRAFT_1068635 [Pisolithus sp. B1]